MPVIKLLPVIDAPPALTVKAPEDVIAPEPRVPFIVLLPVIDAPPAFTVKSPEDVIAPEANVPVVIRCSSLNEIVPLESVIEPLASVKLPIFEPVARVDKPVTDNAPPTFTFLAIPAPPATTIQPVEVEVLCVVLLKLTLPLKSVPLVVFVDVNVPDTITLPFNRIVPDSPTVINSKSFAKESIIFVPFCKVNLLTVVLPSIRVLPVIAAPPADTVNLLEDVIVPVIALLPVIAAPPALTVKSPEDVIAPEASVPVVERFSSPNEIAPLESVIEPLASVKLPIFEPVALVIVDEKIPVPVTFKFPEARVPVVERFSSPNEIVPLESVMEPLAILRAPVVKLACIVP